MSSLGLNYAFIKGSLPAGTAAATASVTVLGEATWFEPAVDSDATTVAQVLNCMAITPRARAGFARSGLPESGAKFHVAA